MMFHMTFVELDKTLCDAPGAKALRASNSCLSRGSDVGSHLVLDSNDGFLQHKERRRKVLPSSPSHPPNNIHPKKHPPFMESWPCEHLESLQSLVPAFQYGCQRRVSVRSSCRLSRRLAA